MDVDMSSEKKSKGIYHYCSLDSFISMVNTHELWLCDVSKSNDRLELKWSWEECSEQAMSILDEFLSHYESLKNEKVDFDIKLLSPNEMKKSFMIGAGSRDSGFSLRAFTLCFTELRDSLGQWRAYGDDGAGLALKFSAKSFCEINKREGFEEFSFVKFGPVEYSKPNNFGVFDALRNELQQRNVSASELLDYIHKGTFISLFQAPFYKNPGFKEEKEWRLAVVSLGDMERRLVNVLDNDWFYRKFFCSAKLGFFARNRQLVPYLALGFNVLDLLDEIQLGPKCPIDEKDLRLFINSTLSNPTEEKEIKISKSVISYV